MQQAKETNELNERVVILERMLQKMQMELGNKSVQIAELSTRWEIEKGKVRQMEEEIKQMKEEIENNEKEAN